MRNTRSASVFLAALLMLLAAVTAHSQKKSATVWPAADIQWMEMKGLPPGAKIAPLWGQVDKGAYGALLRLPGGEKHPLHVHTNDVKLVVISGTFLYTPDGGVEQRLGPGSYLDVPGGLKHSSGTSDEGPCEVFQTSTGKFDMIPVDKMKMK
jgi:quercetin dioxygenase-like cupin family protein